MHPWLLAFAGGILIGLSAVLLMLLLGRIAGISGIASGLLAWPDDWPWRAAFVVGLVIAPLFFLAVTGHDGIGPPQVTWPWMALAGLLVGVGTRLGHGCTSGHGVCGMARLSVRSLVATVTFLVCGMLVVGVIRHVLGGL